jgi:acetyl esterase/lipase
MVVDPPWTAVYARPDAEALCLDVLAPRAPAAPAPAIVHLHGGAFIRGRRDPEQNRLLAECGFVTVSADYRLAPAATFPGQLHDAKAAVRWIRAHAGELGVDPTRIGVWGESAGGQLAALLGTTGDTPELEGDGGWAEHSSSVQAVYVGCAVTDMFEQQRLVPVGDPPGAIEALIGGPLDEHADVARAAGAVTHVHPGCPPFLIVHGDQDRPVHVRNSELLYAALLAAGCDAAFLRLARAPHLGMRGAPRLSRLRADFFERKLRPTRSSDTW